MEFTEYKGSEREFARLGQVAYDDDWVLVLDGDTIVHEIPRGTIMSAGVETRSSFKHPVIGMLLGGVLVGAPISAFLGDPLGIKPVILYDPMHVFMTGFLVFLGVCLYFPAISNKKIDWLVINTEHGERTFPLKCELEDELAEFLLQLGTAEL